MSTQASPTFGALLRRYRLAAGMTQEELAERARLSVAAINTLERGTRRAPRKETLALIAEALALTPSERALLEVAARQRGQTDPLAPAHPAPAGVQPTSPEALMPDTSSPETPTLPTLAAAPGTPPAEGSSIFPSGVMLLAPPRKRGKLIAGLVNVLVMVALLGGSLFLKGELGAGTMTRRPPLLCGGALAIATDFPTTGKKAWAGKPLEHAADLAVMQNQNLGNGYTLKVINYDDRGGYDQVTGPHNVQQMVQNPCIVGMVGPYSSNIAALELPIAANAGLMMISPTNTNPGLTVRPLAKLYGWDFDQLHPAGKPINYFRIPPNDVAQATVDADFTFVDLGARSAYVVDDLLPYGIGLVGFFSERFQADGGRIVGAESIPPDNPALIAQVAAGIVAARPDAVFYGGDTETGPGLLKADLVKRGYTGPFVGGDGIAGNPDFVEQAGVNAANNTFASLAAPDLSTFTSGAAAQFVHDYHARYPGQDLDGYDANAYDAAMVLITAIKHLIGAGQAVTRATMIEQVQHIQYAGVTSPISFDSYGDSMQGVFSLYEVQDGIWAYLKQASA